MNASSLTIIGLLVLISRNQLLLEHTWLVKFPKISSRWRVCCNGSRYNRLVGQASRLFGRSFLSKTYFLSVLFSFNAFYRSFFRCQSSNLGSKFIHFSFQCIHYLDNANIDSEFQSSACSYLSIAVFFSSWESLKFCLSLIVCLMASNFYWICLGLLEKQASVLVRFFFDDRLHLVANCLSSWEEGQILY